MLLQNNIQMLRSSYSAGTNLGTPSFGVAFLFILMGNLQKYNYFKDFSLFLCYSNLVKLADEAKSDQERWMDRQQTCICTILLFFC